MGDSVSVHSSFYIVNDTPAPVWMWVGPSIDVLLWSLAGAFAVATAGAGAAASGAITAAAVGASAAASITAFAVTFKVAAVVCSLSAASSMLTYGVSKSAGMHDVKFKNCLDARLSMEDELDGWTRVDPGGSHWFKGTWSLVMTTWVIDNSGVGWQRKTWTAPGPNGNHRYTLREHFGGVNAQGGDEGLAAQCGENARLCVWYEHPGQTSTTGEMTEYRGRFTSLAAAQKGCNEDDRCNAVVQNSNGYTLRGGTVKEMYYEEGSYTWTFESGCKCVYTEFPGTYSGAYAEPSRTLFTTMEEAAATCDLTTACNAVTQESGGHYTMRKSLQLLSSPSGEVSWKCMKRGEKGSETVGGVKRIELGGFVKVTSGTCESNGHTTIYDRDDCINGASGNGYTITWGPYGGYPDVVNGCSVRGGSMLFLNPASFCTEGSCQCSSNQPCVCKSSGSGSATCHVESSYDYPGGDLRRVHNVESAVKCGETCGSEPQCKSWTYGKKAGQWYTNICFLKNQVKPNRRSGDCCDSGLPCGAGKGLVKVTTGTCESNGHTTIWDRDDCLNGAADNGYTITWGPYGGYPDVVNGCSVRGGSMLFLNPANLCTEGPCQCSSHQPCFCKSGRRRVSEGSLPMLDVTLDEDLMRRADNVNATTVDATIVDATTVLETPEIPDILTGDGEATRLLAWMSASVQEHTNGWQTWESFQEGSQTFEETCTSMSTLRESRKDCMKCLPCLQEGGSCPSECAECAESGPVEPCLIVESGCATEEQAGHQVECLGRLNDEDCFDTLSSLKESLQCYHMKALQRRLL